MKPSHFLPISLAVFAVAVVSCAPFERTTQSDFGKLPDGSPVTRYTLINQSGMQVSVISYGAIITEIVVPDNQGDRRNVIVGSDSMEDYLGRYPAAAVIGRFANRIKNGAFEIDGKPYNVTLNAPTNHIHGGVKGFAKVNWTALALPAGEDSAAVELTYTSPHGEEGYPGNLTAKVVYRLSDDNTLSIQYSAETDRPTIVNLTNHAYFNLANEGGFEDHVLWLNAKSYTLTDDQLVPNGAIASVENTPFDFTTPTAIGERHSEIGAPHPGKYDANFIIAGGGSKLVKAAHVREPVSGRILEVWTDQPGVQLYTGNKRGFCLETQHYPDSINHPHFPSPIVRPDIPFSSETVFAFSVER